MVSEAITSRHLGPSDRGKRLQCEGKGTVIGVVSDIRDQGIRNENENTVYQSASQSLASSQTSFVRCQGSCQPFLERIREAIRRVDPEHSDSFRIDGQDGIRRRIVVGCGAWISVELICRAGVVPEWHGT